MSDFDANADCLSDTDTVQHMPDATSRRHNNAMPVEWPRASVTPAHASLSRRIGRGSSTALPALGDDAVLSLHLVVDETPLADADPVVLTGPSGPIEFADGTRWMRALSGIDLSLEPATDPEHMTWLQSALLGRLADTPFGEAHSMTHSTLSDISDVFTLRLTLRTGSHAVATHARATASVWLKWLENTEWTRAQQPAAVLADLPHEVTVRIARHTLPASALRKLAAGDIIVPDSPRFTNKGEGSIQLGNAYMRVCYREPCSLEIISKEEKLDMQDMDVDLENEAIEAEAEANADTADLIINEPVMNEAVHDEQSDEQDDEQSTPPAANLDGMEKVSVTLGFELGRIRMQLGDMRALSAGVIIPLTGGSPASIAIVAGGRTLGRGEAVDVNGQLGIRIIHWGTAC